MSLVEVARRVVLRTNHWPGLKTLYSHAYDLGLAFTVNRLSSVPAVLAVLVRTNDDGRVWVPGLSDYDLTVLTDQHDWPGAIRFLDDVWERYRSIKRVAPQLGEMEVMDLEGYGDLLDFGPMPTASLKRAHPLFVRAGDRDVERVLARTRRPSQPGEFLLDALSRFGRFAVPAWLEDARRGNGVTCRRAEHLLGNVAKRLSRIGVPAETTGTGTVTDRMVTVFQALSSACRLIKSRASGPAAVIDPHVSSIAIDTLQPIHAFCEDVLRHARVTSCSAVVWKSYMTVDRLNLVFILPDDVPEDDLRRLLATLAALNHRVEGLLTGKSMPRVAQDHVPSAFSVVASDSMWRCWRELSPFDAVAVAATGRTLIGASDPDHAVPSVPAMRRGAAVLYASLLPLKNNWRQSKGRATGQSYAPLVNHARGYASAFTGPVLTVPAELEFTSTKDGYVAAFDALEDLRAHLRAEERQPSSVAR